VLNKKSNSTAGGKNGGQNSTKKEEPDDVAAFVKSTKRLALQGYMTSQYYLTKVQPYKLVPGKFEGCIPVASLNQKERSI
jgi:hypothetical protein